MKASTSAAVSRSAAPVSTAQEMELQKLVTEKQLLQAQIAKLEGRVTELSRYTNENHAKIPKPIYNGPPRSTQKPLVPCANPACGYAGYAIKVTGGRLKCGACGKAFDNNKDPLPAEVVIHGGTIIQPCSTERCPGYAKVINGELVCSKCGRPRHKLVG